MVPVPRVRPAAVAGSFYPDDEVVLAGTVDGLLADVARPAPADRPVRYPAALIAPHAGYLYSGPVAASAFARLRDATARPERIVLLGPSHRVPIAGLALPDADVTAFATPLGAVALEPVPETLLAQLPALVRSDAAHAREHSLEVELPFLQRLLGEFRLVPLSVGQATDVEVADAIEALVDDTTLVLVSTDLSHYLPDPLARPRDERTAAAIERLDPAAIDATDACGAVPLRGLLTWAARHRLSCQRLDLRNSSDTAGGPERVVGYGAWELT